MGLSANVSTLAAVPSAPRLNILWLQYSRWHRRAREEHGNGIRRVREEGDSILYMISRGCIELRLE